MLAVSYCCQCIEEMRQYGEIADIFFEQCCEYYLITGECIHFTPSDRQFFYDYSGLISFLEKKGYILTTEYGKDLIKVKPLGIECETQDGKCFCHICFDKVGHE